MSLLADSGFSRVAAGPVAHSAHTVSAWSLLAQLLVGMAVILAIILLATRFLGGKGRRLVGANRRGMLISVLARQNMGKGVSVVIVRAGSDAYLLGVTPHQVTRLDQLDPDVLSGDKPADPARSPLLSAPQDGSESGWGSFVSRLQDRSVRR